MKVLETRIRHGLKWRRRRAEDGREITTLEVPESVLFHVTTHARLLASVARWQRKQATDARRAHGKALLAEGWKPVAVAHELGVAVRSVEAWRRGDR